jgi:hypothetical protein
MKCIEVAVHLSGGLKLTAGSPVGEYSRTAETLLDNLLLIVQHPTDGFANLNIRGITKTEI